MLSLFGRCVGHDDDKLRVTGQIGAKSREHSLHRRHVDIAGFQWPRFGADLDEKIMLVRC